MMVFFWLTLSCRVHVQCVQVVQDTWCLLTVVTYWLLLISSCYANTFFNICFCIILNTYFLTDCLTTIYFIILLLFYPDICPSCFTLLLAYHKPGEGRVLSRTHIWDSYPWLRSETYEISDRSIKLNNRDWSISHTSFRHYIYFVFTLIHHLCIPFWVL